MPVRKSSKAGGSRKVRKTKSRVKSTSSSNGSKNVDLSNVMGRCMRCKKQQKMAGASKVTMKNGRHAAKGNCHICQTKMYRIL